MPNITTNHAITHTNALLRAKNTTPLIRIWIFTFTKLESGGNFSHLPVIEKF